MEAIIEKEKEEISTFIDPQSFAVFTTLGINIIGSFLIFLGWLCFRRLRGDKKAPPSKHETQSRQSQLL
jgi:hypothetical protein